MHTMISAAPGDPGRPYTGQPDPLADLTGPSAAELAALDREMPALMAELQAMTRAAAAESTPTPRTRRLARWSAAAATRVRRMTSRGGGGRG